MLVPPQEIINIKKQFKNVSPLEISYEESILLNQVTFQIQFTRMP